MNEELEVRFHSCQKENQLLKEEIKDKQKIIETVLNQNYELLKFRYYFGQNGIGKKDGGYKFKEHKKKGNDSERDGDQQITSINKIPRKNNNLATKNNIGQYVSP